MRRYTLSRREFLAASGLGTAAVLAGCASTVLTRPPVYPTVNPASPFLTGPYQTARAILGETAGTTAMLQPLTSDQLPPDPFDYSVYYNQVCQDGQPVNAPLPARVPAAVYYPTNPRDHRVPTPNPLAIASGPFPILLFAHAFRDTRFACKFATDPHRDFISIDVILHHVASYGCVCVAPDLSWLPGGDWPGDHEEGVFTTRAAVLLASYLYLSSLNTTLFAKQLDLTRVVLVGHSDGAGGAVYAGRSPLWEYIHPQSLAYGLIAPVTGETPSPSGVSTDVHNLLALHGTLDDVGVAAPAAYAAGGGPKTLVTITGANHFGYTDLCDADNSCATAGLFDTNGTISRAGQQLTAAAYLAALVRYYALGDDTARPYLTGARQVEGLDPSIITGIQVQSAGFGPSAMPSPPPTIGTHP